MTLIYGMPQHANLVLPTAEMKPWTGEAPPQIIWETFTELGPFRPNHSPMVSVATRTAHQARHTARLRWGRVKQWASSRGREIADVLVGSFLPVTAA